MVDIQLPILIDIEGLLPNIAQQHYRLALVLGSGKTPLLTELCRRQDLPYLNVNLALNHRHLDLTSKERPLRVRRLLAAVIDEYPVEIIALDNVELLFDPATGSGPQIYQDMQPKFLCELHKARH